MSWAVAQKVGNPVAKATLILLSQIVDEGGSTSVGNKFLRETLELSQSSIIRALQLLEAQGLISRQTNFLSTFGRTTDTITLEVSR